MARLCRVARARPRARLFLLPADQLPLGQAMATVHEAGFDPQPFPSLSGSPWPRSGGAFSLRSPVRSPRQAQLMTTICLGADIETNPLAPRLSDGLTGRGAFLGAWPLRQECARGRPVSPHDARRHLAPLRSGAAFSFGLRRISDTATKSSARRSVGGLPSNAGARFPVYRSLCWARAQVGKLFAS